MAQDPLVCNNSITTKLGNSHIYIYLNKKWPQFIRCSTILFISNFRKVYIFRQALLIGLSQFVPEVTDKRIKLSLHLPMENTTVIYSMVLFGFAIITAIQLISVLLLTLFMSVYFPSEIIIPSLQTILPWILGGMTCYFFIAMISLEPIWKYRFLYIIFV